MSKQDQSNGTIAEAARQMEGTNLQKQLAEMPAFWTWEDMSDFARNGRRPGDVRRAPEAEALRLVVECERISERGEIPCVEIPQTGPARIRGLDPRAVTAAVRAKVDVGGGGEAIGGATGQRGAEPVDSGMRGDALGLPFFPTWQAYFASADHLKSPSGDELGSQPKSLASPGRVSVAPVRLARARRSLH